MAKILIVEDDNFLQGLEAMKLKKEGFDVFVASNANDAFKTFEKEGKLDMMLLDLMLPEIDGFAVLEKIRKDAVHKDTPVIVFSNMYEDKDITRANTLGISEFMIKSNFTLDELVTKIREIIK